jgi:hypothetical protein
MGRAVLTVAAILVVGVARAGGAVTASPAFHLEFTGKHNENLWHEGPFTTSASFCPTGYAMDVDVDDTTLTTTRRFTCSSGDAFTARLGSLRAEHGGTGTWEIVGGTGGLADFRGHGEFTSTRLSGSTDDPLSITFKSAWDGVADFDVTAPTITVATATVRKLARPKGLSQLRVTASLADSGGAVAYHVAVSDARKPLLLLGQKSGTAATSPLAIALRFRPPRGMRALRLQIDATDPVGNQSKLVRVIRVPR